MYKDQLSLPKKEAFWKNHFENWKQSGISQKQYCFENNIKLSTFSYWIARLRRKPNDIKGFIEIPGIKTTKADFIELIIKNKIVIRIRPDIDFDFLITTLQALGVNL